MNARDFADSLNAASDHIHALLIEVRRHVDVADHDARFGLIERQLQAMLHEVAYLARLAEEEAEDEELKALLAEVRP